MSSTNSYITGASCLKNGFVAEGQPAATAPSKFRAVRKLSEILFDVEKIVLKNAKFGVEDLNFREIYQQIEILSTPIISSVGNLQPSVGELQLPAPPRRLAYTDEAAVPV